MFQGRYKAILVRIEAHLLELSRYVMLKPVRTEMVQLPEELPWSSYPLVMNDQLMPERLDADRLLGQFGTQRTAARRNFKQIVLHGVGLDNCRLRINAARHRVWKTMQHKCSIATKQW
ncbi:hypothetical protein ACO0K8_17420 [Undibacterium sp. Ren11W]